MRAWPRQWGKHAFPSLAQGSRVRGVVMVRVRPRVAVLQAELSADVGELTNRDYLGRLRSSGYV
jgi:hypothetical protein